MISIAKRVHFAVAILVVFAVVSWDVSARAGESARVSKSTRDVVDDQLIDIDVDRWAEVLALRDIVSADLRACREAQGESQGSVCSEASDHSKQKAASALATACPDLVDVICVEEVIERVFEPGPERALPVNPSDDTQLVLLFVNSCTGGSNSCTQAGFDVLVANFCARALIPMCGTGLGVNPGPGLPPAPDPDLPSSDGAIPDQSSPSCTRYWSSSESAWIYNGGSGPDICVGTYQRDIFWVGGGEDEVYGMEGDDEIHLGGGDDKALAGSGDDDVYAGAGNDVVYGELGRDTIRLGESSLDPDNGFDVGYGGRGNDTILGMDGADAVYGNKNDDTLTGGANGDVIEGGPGNDSLKGNKNSDTMYGQEGDDRLEDDDGWDGDAYFCGEDNAQGTGDHDVAYDGPFDTLVDCEERHHDSFP